LRLRNGQPVPDEHHRHVDRAVQLAARAQRRVLANHQRFLLPVSNQRELRLLQNQGARLEFHRLSITGEPAGLQPDVLELSLDVGGGLLEPWRSDVAPFERVVGEEGDVTPPSLAFGGRVLDEEDDQRGEQIWALHRLPNGTSYFLQRRSDYARLQSK